MQREWVVFRPKANGERRGYWRVTGKPYESRRPRYTIYIPRHVQRALHDDPVDRQILIEEVWEYMTKDMIITAIKTQNPGMKICSKDRKLKLIRQWLSTGIEDPFEEWQPLLDRFLAAMKRRVQAVQQQWNKIDRWDDTVIVNTPCTNKLSSCRIELPIVTVEECALSQKKKTVLSTHLQVIV